MPQYLLQLSYTADSLKAQMKNPEDRLTVVGDQLRQSLGVTFLGGGYMFGEHDLAVIMEAADDATMAGVAIAFLAGGAVKACKTTPLLNGSQWITALQTASRATYKPAL
jgi:uncharacterized protein with GYD domain